MSLNSVGSLCIYENLLDKSCPKQFWSVEADLEKRFTCCARSWPVASGFCYRGRSNYLANYKVQLLQYLRSLAAAQLSIKKNSTPVQIASGAQRCGKRFLISPPSMHVFRKSHGSLLLRLCSKTQRWSSLWNPCQSVAFLFFAPDQWPLAYDRRRASHHHHLER